MNIIFIGCIILSILQSILFWNKNTGISLLIFILPTILFLAYILLKNNKIQNKKSLLLSIPIILLCSTYFIFNNNLFRFLNFFVILGLFLIMIIWSTTDNIKFKFLISKMLSLLFSPFRYFKNVFKSFKSSTVQSKTKIHYLFKIIKAILISIPLVLIILALLISADSIFEDMFGFVTDFIGSLFENAKIVDLIFRFVFIFFVFMYFAGFILNVIDENPKYTKICENRENSENITESFTVNTILTILNIIYLVFSVIQFVYLFGGSYRFDSNFNYSAYARQGFFQLMFVSLINFIIILISNKPNNSKKSNKYTVIMNILICFFTAIIIISSFFRMYLYELEFGYTYLRLLVYFSLITELILLLPTILYILKQNINIYKSYIIIVTIMYLVLNFANIDYIIAKRNIDRYFEDPINNEIDFSYLKYNIGTDGISQITRLLDTSDSEVNIQVKNYLYSYKSKLNSENLSLQEFNLSKFKAKSLLNSLNITKDVDLNYFY